MYSKLHARLAFLNCPRPWERLSPRTSMGDDAQVGSDDLHVDPVLLLPDDHRPPETPVGAHPLVVHLPWAIRGGRLGGGHRRVVWTGREETLSDRRVSGLNHRGLGSVSRRPPLDGTR